MLELANIVPFDADLKLTSNLKRQKCDEMSDFNNSGFLNDFLDNSMHIETIIPNSDYYSGKVEKIINKGKNHVNIIISRENGSTETLVLKDSWHENFESNIKCGDRLNVIGSNQTEFDDKESQYKIPNLLILNPECLVTGTNIIESMGCLRKVILKSIWPGSYENDCNPDLKSNRFLIFGKILHEIFQDMISGTTNDTFDNIFKQKIDFEVICDLILSDLTYSDLNKELSNYKSSVNNWINLFKTKSKIGNLNFKEIHGIEESFWSLKYGLNGKIDIVMNIEEENNRFLCPIELKSGKPRYSVEHFGQVLLYILLLQERYPLDKLPFGLLVYLSENCSTIIHQGKMNKMRIDSNQTSFRALIQRRNEIVFGYQDLHSLPDRIKLPKKTSNQNLCQYCSHKKTCNLLADIEDNFNLSCSIIEEDDKVSQVHVQFFQKWTRFILAEIKCSPSQIETIGKIKSDNDHTIKGSLIEITKKDEKNYSITLVTDVELDEPKLAIGQMKVLSGDTPDLKFIGLSLVKISNLEFPKTLSFTMDQKPPENLKKFRLDDYHTLKNFQRSMGNLVNLMDENGVANRLRRLIIDKSKPVVLKKLNKDLILNLMQFLKILNRQQKSAVIKCLLCQDYCLIKGLPGCGKTQLISALIYALIYLNKKILLVSHTHGAVDNVINRLLEMSSKLKSKLKIGRLGSNMGSINPNVDIETRMKNIEKLVKSGKISYEDFIPMMKQEMKKFNLIACTALASSGGADLRNKWLNLYLKLNEPFDYVIIDEAGQLSLDVTLGPLMLMDKHKGKFVLVGDPDQLPPLFLSETVNRDPSPKSLLHHLLIDCSIDDVDQIAKLSLQYRMNRTILKIANEIVYNGILESDSDIILDRTVDFSKEKLKNCENGLIKACCSDRIEDAVVFIETSNIVDCSLISPGISCLQEKKIVSQILKETTSLYGLEILAKFAIITPYRDQMNDFKTAFSSLYSISISTIDQFQGRDADVVILCLGKCINPECLQFKKSASIDGTRKHILSDQSRFAVAMTRAKRKFIIIGRNCNAKLDYKFDSRNILDDLYVYLKNNLKIGKNYIVL